MPGAWLDALPLAAAILSAEGKIAAQNERAASLPLAEWLRSPQLAQMRAQVQGTGSSRQWHEAPAGLHEPVRGWMSAYEGRVVVLCETRSAHSPSMHAPLLASLSTHLAASLAHEIRNPLLAIRGAAQLLQPNITAEDTPLAELILSEVARIEALMQALDPLSPTSSDAFEEINIHEVLEYVLTAAATAAPSLPHFVRHYDPSLPQLYGVKSRLIQALMNLVKNACEALYGRADATLTLRTRYLYGEQLKRADGVKLPLQVSIEDNGAGIPPAAQERLFAPFVSEKQGGKGLGLAIVAAIMAHHGGLITCRSPLSAAGGTGFYLYFPAPSRTPA
jgi:two-component system nitrogen regulation sensor histidine kinase GlnL